MPHRRETLTIDIADIARAVPGATVITLPEAWMTQALQRRPMPSNRESVFSLLYTWLAKDHRYALDNLHNRTHVGAALMERLCQGETQRLRRQHHLVGDALAHAVSWNNMDEGPQEMVHGYLLTGDALVVLPEDTETETALCALIEQQRTAHTRRIRHHAHGATFTAWLHCHTERDDGIGDLARDLCKDSEAPEARHYETLRQYLEDQHACNAALDRLADAWKEYTEDYPIRALALAWCDGCQREIATLDEATLGCDGEELFCVHVVCPTVPDGEWFPASWRDALTMASASLATMLASPTLAQVTAFAATCEMDPWTLEVFLARLHLWGFGGTRARPLRRMRRDAGAARHARASLAGHVYILQALGTSRVKIGRSGSLQQRTHAMHTASPFALQILRAIATEDTRRLEKVLHDRYHAYRVYREWFELPEPLLAQLLKEVFV